LRFSRESDSAGKLSSSGAIEAEKLMPVRYPASEERYWRRLGDACRDDQNAENFSFVPSLDNNTQLRLNELRQPACEE
jgi:hypothetical protein